MPRQARESSGTGIYHVMMRGINHQNIFEEQEDYYQFLNTLDMMAQSYEPDGTPSGRLLRKFRKLLEMTEQYRRKNQWE